MAVGKAVGISAEDNNRRRAVSRVRGIGGVMTMRKGVRTGSITLMRMRGGGRGDGRSGSARMNELWDFLVGGVC